MKKVFSSMLLTAFLAVSGSAWALSQIDGVYQIGTAEDLKAFAELVNDGDVHAKAVLTADIDYTTDAVQIGNPTFMGVFDGQGHTVTIAFEGTDTEGVNAALFYKMAGIVKNLRVSGTVTSPKKFAASIAYFLYGWIDHCYSDVTITSTFSGQSCCGGIAGQCFNGGLFSNCYFAGKFTSETATRFSGIMGWSNGQNSVVNSLVYATCEGTACTNDGWKIAGDCSRVDNNYSLYNAEAKLQNQSKKAGRYIIGCFDTNTDELASGEIAYKLNWGQEIGVDPTPDPMSTHTVYPLGSCKEPTGYTNDAALSAHSYSGYKCTVCGAYNPDFMTPVNGYYEIGTPEQLAWFSLYVHEKHCDANARLTADIDLSSFPNFGMIGTSGADTCYYSMYRGTFEGEYHKISNLNINMPSVASVGLFASVAAPAKIKNLYLDETCTISGNKQVGGIVGHVIGNVDGDEVTLLSLGSAASVSSKSGVSDAGVGGIVGKAYGVTCDIMNCWFQGTLSGTSLGFISGWCGNKPRVTSCWSTCSSEGVTALVRCASAEMQNCFATQGTQVTRITAEDVASGALCYGLNKGLDAPAWFQTIGTDAKPTLTGSDVVYKNGTLFCDGSDNEVTYANTETSLTLGDHVGFTDNVCTKCGIGLLDGVYQLSKPAHLTWFANYVNKGNGATGAEVTANIDMKDQGWTGMTAYAGTFDGGNFTISNLGAPFCLTTEGNAVIRNLTLAAAEPLVYTGTEDGFGAFICRSNQAAVGTTTIENCVNKTAVDNQSEKSRTGGFIGSCGVINKSNTITIRNCQNLAAVSAYSRVGGLVGQFYYGALVIENSTNAANVSARSNMVGGLIGQAGNTYSGTINVSDCCNTGVITAANQHAGGIVGLSYGASTATYTRCWNEGAVTGTDRAAGILGYVANNTDKVTMSDCFNVAEISSTTHAGAIIGTDSSPYLASTITNCWNSGKVSGNGFSSTTKITLSNCFDVNGSGTGITQVTAEQVASGALCYGLNKGILYPSWYQTIGEDAHPVFDTTHGIVNQITAAGYATQYIADTDVTIPADVKAYTGKVNGDYLTLTEVTEKIPAAAAVVLEGAEGYYSFVPTTGAAAVAENDLKGAATALTADGSQYVLAKKDDVVGFYQATEGTIAAGKAYLTGISAGVKAITFGTATSLTPALSEEREAVIYDLSGRRVEKATKGIYIINGKKVLK